MQASGTSHPGVIGPGRWTYILPAAFLMYTISFFDRTNLGVALPFITKDLGLTSVEAGWIGGAFSWGYVVTQLAAGLIVFRFGSRRVVGASLILFGAAAMAVGLARGFTELFLARALLGLAEGPIYTATTLLLSQWFMKRERGRAFGIWNLSTGFGAFLAGPLSGAILAHYNWRVMMVAEGLPAWIFAVVWFWSVPKSLEAAPWLSERDRQIIAADLEAEQKAVTSVGFDPWWSILREPALWLMLAGYSLNNILTYGFTIWLPSALKTIEGLSIFAVGIFSGLPFAAAMLGMLYITRRSDKHGQERRLHAAVPTALTGALMIAAAWVPPSLWPLQVVLFTAMGFLMKMLLPLVFTRVTEILPARKAVPAVALISGIGNLLGQVVGPLAIGYLKSPGAGFVLPWTVLGCCSIVGGVCVALAKSRDTSAGQRKPQSSAPTAVLPTLPGQRP